jgi:16S rRNA C967 or C1407 C5-methylase (RsmB/RsmF family)
LKETPPKLLRLAASLFEDEATRGAFAETVLKCQPYRPALIWLRDRPEETPFRIEEPQSWQPDFVDRLCRDQRPGQHSLHDEGAYYCMTFSSVFEACAFRVVPRNPGLVLDLCAAPGGKSVMAWRLLQPRMLLANEVIRKRTAQLVSNFKRCGIMPAAVTSMDTSTVAERFGPSADLVIVDAPCSGQSMIAKGKQVSAAFHSHVINHNRNRQRRILGNAARLVKPGGWLAYITCTYAEKENEGNVRWMLKTFSGFTAETVPELEVYQSHLADFSCYRMWPQDGLGAGGFVAMLRRNDPGEAAPFDLGRVDALWRSGGGDFGHEQD